MKRILPPVVRYVLTIAPAGLILAGCLGPDADLPPPIEVQRGGELTIDDRVGTIDGLTGPEAVRYDADQDVWFVANFGPGEGRDADGFVSRVDAETLEVTELRFAAGTPTHPLHQPRGMFLTGDTLWVVDTDGVHGFDRSSGLQRVFRDFTALEPGFLNDIARGPDGLLYVTDTGRSALYVLDGSEARAVFVDASLGSPNGITLGPDGRALVLVPWEPGYPVRAWSPGEVAPGALGGGTAGRLDGVEVVDGRLLIASQTDSTLQLHDTSGARSVIRVDGAPADIGVDTRRRRVAVPYIALDRVDVWPLPDRRPGTRP